MNGQKTSGLRRVFLYTVAALKWLPAAALTGLAGGAVCAGLHIGIRYATIFRTEHGYVTWMLPVGAVLILLWYKLLRIHPTVGTNRAIDAANDISKDVPPALVPAIFGATVLTQFAGGSAGRAGAALQIGGGLGYNLGKLFRLNAHTRQLLVLCGMSAVFSALFGTPIGAVMFVLEVLAVGRFRYGALVPCITASLVAYFLNVLCGTEQRGLTIAAPEGDTLVMFFQTAAFGILCALVSILFVVTVHRCEHYAGKLLKNTYLRALVLGCVLLGMTLLSGGQKYNGAGMDYVTYTVESGGAIWYDFLLKLLFTAVTLAAGYKGGEIAPTFFVGATFGAAAAPLLGMNASLGAALGMIAVFCGVTNCPIASVVLAVEFFGGGHLPLFALACGLSYVFSGYFGLYRSQRILHSKVGHDEIDINTWE